jgi:UDP-glucose 4-epimerase
LIELLLQTNYNIIAIDNFSNSNSESYVRVKNITSKNFEILNLDLCNYTTLINSLNEESNIIGVIHFAAFKSVPDSVKDPLLYYNNNLNSLSNILKLCNEKKISNFIFSSSCSVYGNADELPVSEHTPIKKAESPYAHTKQIGEEMINFYCKANPWFNAIMLRYFNPVGAHLSGLNGELPISKPNNLVPIITQTAVGKNALTVFGNDYNTRDGFCIRDYIHVSDVANAHIIALQQLIEHKSKSNLSLYNLGFGNGVSVIEVIRSFERVSGIKLNYQIGNRRIGDVIAVYSNNAKIYSELNWIPKYNLDDMMLSAWKWQQYLEKK